jgi:hypothetical protein
MVYQEQLNFEDWYLIQEGRHDLDFWLFFILIILLSTFGKQIGLKEIGW